MQWRQLSNPAIGEGSLTALHRITTLPNEIFFKILTCLPWRNIVRCRHLCRWVRDEVDRSAKFQYLIALGLSAMEDGLVVGPLSSADRLRLLVAHQQAWRSLTWRKIVTFPVPFSASSPTRFSDGMLLICPKIDQQSLYSLRLPDTVEVDTGVELKWSQAKLGFEISDFRPDVEQDLLVLIESVRATRQIRFHFRMLSTKSPHPAASSSILEYNCRPGDRYSVAHITGSHIIINFSNPTSSKGGRLLAYSWTTGHKRAYVRVQRGFDLDSFTFLSSHIFVIPFEVSFDLYSFDPESTIDPAPVLHPIVSFHFPPRSNPHVCFMCHSNPYPRGDLSHLRSNEIKMLHSPFSMDREDGILIFRLRSTFVRRFGPGPWFVVHRSALLSFLDEDWDDFQGAKNVFWDEWGPRYTRWFEADNSMRKVSTMRGHRLLLLESVPDDTASKFIVALDFNPAAVSKALSCSVATDLVTTPSTLVGGRLFETDIESKLPYLEVQSNTPFICSGAVPDGQRILMIKRVNDDFDTFSVLYL